MRTSLNEIEQVESYLMHTMQPGERLAFEGRVLVDKQLQFNIKLQERLYGLLKIFHQKRSINNAGDRLFQNRSFLDKINSLLN